MSNVSHKGTQRFDFKKLILSLAGMALISSAASARVYPERPVNLDVIYTGNVYADLAAKVWMIDNAKSNVAVSAFIIGQDNIGLTIADALRRASNRGVEVRVLYEGTIGRTLGKDFRQRIPDLLTDPNLVKPAQVINLDILEKRKTNLAISDYVHQKLVMVDLKTANEMIYLGGRDLADFSKGTIDSGYILRPIDRQYSYVGDDIRRFYNLNWVFAREYFKKYETTKNDLKIALEVLSSNTPAESFYTDEDRAEVDKVIALLKVPAGQVTTLAPDQFRPEKAQIVTNDLLRELLQGKYQKSSSVRPELFEKDDILNTLVSHVQKAKRIEITAYAGHLVPPLHEALKNFVDHGSLSIYTNGEDAMSSQDAIGVSAVSYDFTLQAMQDIATKHEPGAGHNFEVLALDKEAAMKQSNGRINYIHRKQMLIDDEYVVAGSYNFTESSSSKNDEFVIFFSDPRMNAHHKEVTRIEKESVFTPMDLSPISVLKRTKNSIKSFFMGDMVRSQF